jgi:hypothetical protein
MVFMHGCGQRNGQTHDAHMVDASTSIFARGMGKQTGGLQTDGWFADPFGTGKGPQTAFGYPFRRSNTVPNFGGVGVRQTSLSNRNTRPPLAES